MPKNTKNEWVTVRVGKPLRTALISEAKSQRRTLSAMCELILNSYVLQQKTTKKESAA